MNLVTDYINELGGYEVAKEKSTSWLLNHGENWRNVKDATLLEYRRQHNIFEVGDSVVLINGHTNTVHYLSGWYIEGLDFRYTTKPSGWGVIVKANMLGIWRHATDAEIKAGKRLEVNDGNSI